MTLLLLFPVDVEMDQPTMIAGEARLTISGSRDQDLGDRPRVRAEFVDLSGVAGDPQTVTVTVRMPGGGATTLTATHVSTGIYDVYVGLSTSGLWGVRAAGTGGLQAAAEAVLKVRRSEVI